MKLALRIGGFVLAAAILAVLIAYVGVEELAAQLSLVGPGFVWILVLHGFAMVLAAFPWFILLPQATRPTLAGAIASRFFASGANAVLPLFGLGGELVRLLWQRKSDRAAGIAGLVVDRLMYGAASATLLAIGLVGLLHLPALPGDYARTAAIGIVVLLVLVGVGCVLAIKYPIAAKLQHLIRRMRKQLDRDTQFGNDVDHHIAAMLRFSSRGPWLAWALHTLGRCAIGAELAVGFYLLGAPLSWDEALVFGALPVILALAGAIIPSQLGVHEGAQALVAASLGISPTTAVAVVLLMRLRQLAGAAILGPLLLVHRRRGSPPPATPPPPTPPEPTPPEPTLQRRWSAAS